MPTEPTSKPKRRRASMEDRVRELELLSEFLYHWTIRQDEHIRNLVAKIGGLDGETAHNDEAFDYKWKELGFGKNSLADEEHKQEVADLVCHYTGLEPEWFAGKRVLDAGCGDGRMSYGFCRLGAKVTSIDITPTGPENTRKACAEFADHEARQWNVLDPLPDGEVFDLVFSFGVLHCTGDTERGVANLCNVLKPGGRFSMMVYGYPRLGQNNDFVHMNTKESIRQRIRGMSFEQVKAYLLERFEPERVRGWYDAVTPVVEDHYTVEQVIEMAQRYGIEDLRQIDAFRRNIIIVGRKRTG